MVFTNHLNEIDKSVSYGYGWVPFKSGERFDKGDLDLQEPYYIHGGSTEGYQSMAASINNGQTYIVILSNSGNGRKIFELTKTIAHAIYPN